MAINYRHGGGKATTGIHRVGERFGAPKKVTSKVERSKVESRRKRRKDKDEPNPNRALPGESEGLIKVQKSRRASRSPTIGIGRLRVVRETARVDPGPSR